MPTEYMVQKLDPDGLPRAWAVSEDLDLAKEHAAEQLDLYIESKQGTSRTWARDEFTTSVIKFTEKESSDVEAQEKEQGHSDNEEDLRKAVE